MRTVDGEPLEALRVRVRQTAGLPQEFFEGLQARRFRQLAEHHEVRHRRERLLREAFDGVAAVVQAPGLASTSDTAVLSTTTPSRPFFTSIAAFMASP
jgi:hypothetical protein